MGRSVLFMGVMLASFVAASEPDKPRLVADLNQGVGGSGPRGFFVWNNTVWFSAYSSQNGQDTMSLYCADGRPDGTRRVKVLPVQKQGAVFENPIVFQNRLYFQGPNAGLGKGSRVWVTDGTEAGTVPISEDGKDVCDDLPPFLFRNRLLLSLHGAYKGHGLVALDLPTGTTEVLSVPFDGWADYDEPVMLKDTVLKLDSAGTAFWSIDGTASGMKKLELPGLPAFENDDRVNQLLSLPNGVLMLPNGSTQPWVFWHTDGKSARKLASWSWPERQASRFWFGRVGDLGVMLVYDRSRRCGLWRSDGTVEGSKTVLDSDPYKDANFSLQDGRLPAPLLAGGRLFFEMDDGQHGLELWCSDGTQGGTHRVSDIAPGAGDAEISWLRALPDGRVAIQCSHAETGREVWVTDGTQKGTLKLGAFGTRAVDVATVLNGLLLLVADSEEFGRELWALDIPSAIPPAKREVRSR